MIHVFDGAMGTMLHQAGLEPGQCPELWNIEQPENVIAIHRQYVEAGATIIETNTFGANRIKLTHYGLESKVAALNAAGVTAARQAAGTHAKVAGSIGPTGKFIAPLGELTFDTAYDVFYEQIHALDQAGVDYILIETIIDIQEMRAALLAAKAATNKPVICQLSFDADGRTVTGTDPRTAAITLEAMGASIIGANCSLGPAQLLPVIETLAQSCSLPISVQPNAGMPELINGQTVFPMQADEMAAWIPKLAAAGATFIGGCCGTTPAHIKAIRQTVDKLPSPPERRLQHVTALTSRTRAIYLGPQFAPVIIGERINPTGRKTLANDLKEGNFVTVKKDALAQIKAGAGILDVNMGVPGVDQIALMKQAVEELSVLVDVPLAIDTTDPAALEAGLKAYPGRALINSITAETERLESFLPLAKKYGAAVLCLPLSDSGVPTTAVERIKVAQQIIDIALSHGLNRHDLLLDALVMTVATDGRAAAETLLTLKLYREQLGCPAVMGLSNVSFGLPRRDLMNAAFCAMALASGLDAPILNPFDPLMQDIWSAATALGGHDNQAIAYSKKYVDMPAQTAAVSNAAPDILTQIRQTVVNGETTGVVPLIRQALAEHHTPLTITEQALTAAMNEVGQAFGQGRCFLPQVLLSAETMRTAFMTIKEVLPSHTTQSLGTVLLATVKGDIHDLGKNIVAALMENNGFTVIDLGKDVAPETIVAAAKEHQAQLVGLCALMTTTLPQVDITISALKAAGYTGKSIVGGAVLTESYARQAGADAYAANGVAAVNIAKKLLGC
ncbi:homocysteine S-methyltransferase family protein [Sporomusa malonica]|uniref:Methionine synthase n=1 Tax=Sporomusa malonica TaxID=112901 RepID=A0A1W2D2V4_9FIRM|nr:homocysteine S-methyltransferase family protein [Sporomusa malonica]SMC91496.1 5-methyltetrahydrofolate--homocysteine methyltransferase [Sporomusa malonica]